MVRLFIGLVAHYAATITCQKSTNRCLAVLQGAAQRMHKRACLLTGRYLALLQGLESFDRLFIVEPAGWSAWWYVDAR
jgi:hypothetical protein